MVNKLLNIVLLIPFVMLTSSHADEQLSGRRLAVVVGVDKYRVNGGLGDLAYAGADAGSISEGLRNAGFTVIEMTHETARKPGKEHLAPNRTYIRDMISSILETPNLGRNDTVLISLHGHGVHYDEVSKDNQKIPKFYFCPADASIRGVETANDITDRNFLISTDELYKSLGDCKAATRLLIVDACRNDPNRTQEFRSAPLASKTMPKLPPPPGGIAAFFSCKANQMAIEDKDLGHGVFSHFLVKGLQGEADLSFGGKPADGVITFSELSTYVANSTYAYVLNKYKGRRKQSPDIRGEFDTNLPLARIQTMPNAAGIEFVKIPAGNFLMGSPESEEGRNEDEGPQHRVTISKPFYAGKYEVTIGQILQWLNATGVKMGRNWIDLDHPDCPIEYFADRDYLYESSDVDRSRYRRRDRTKFAVSDQQPMQNISWHGAVAFCEWCSQQDPKFTYRLPTEAEWEYMGRAGSTTAYPWGDSLNGTQANIDGNFPYGTETKGTFPEVTKNVGSYPANKWGLYDTAGNVYEWCSDWYDAEYYGSSPTSDTTGPGSGSSRVLRGGSWRREATYARSADRYNNAPSGRYNHVGFRVVSE